MKITASRQALLDSLLVVSRAVSARAALQALSGIHVAAAGGEVAAPRHRHGARPRRRPRRQGRRATARSSSPAGSWSRSRARSRTARSRSSCASPSATSRSPPAPRASTCGSFPPTTSRASRRPRATPSSSRRQPLQETIGAGRAGRVARRGPAGPDRGPGHRRGRGADDGRHRLLPARGEADRSSSPPVAEKLEANIPARALRELARLIEAAPEEPLQVWLSRNQAIFRVGPGRSARG